MTFPILLFFLLATACSERPHSQRSQFGMGDPSIVGGSPAEGSSMEARSTVFVRAQVEFKEDGVNTIYSQNCTGSLITQNIVLTAAHCLDAMNITTKSGAIKKEVTKVEVIFSLNPKLEKNRNSIIAVEEIQTHPFWKDLSKRNSTSGDLTLLKLARTAPEGFRPVKLSKQTVSSLDERPVTVLGYGLTDEAQAGQQNRDLRLMIKTLKMWSSESIDTELANGEISKEEAQTFRHNSDNGRNYLLDQRQGGSCFGDSGGPAFVQSSTAPQGIIQIGVAQSVARYKTVVDSATGLNRIEQDSEKACRGVSNYTNISWDRYRLWISKTTQEMGSQEDLFTEL